MTSKPEIMMPTRNYQLDTHHCMCVFLEISKFIKGICTTECWKLISASARQVAKNWKNVLRLCARLQFDLWKQMGWWSLLWFGKLEQWSRKNNMEVCNKHRIDHGISTSHVSIDDRWFIYCKLINSCWVDPCESLWKDPSLLDLTPTSWWPGEGRKGGCVVVHHTGATAAGPLLHLCS